MRNCRMMEMEEKRVNKELANIRQKFKSETNGYNTKKYIAKLLYLHVLGYEIDFGHHEAVKLLSSTKYSEKQMGYLAITLLLTESEHLNSEISMAMRRDLNGPSDIFTCMALNAIANMGHRSLCESFVDDIYQLFIASDRIPRPSNFVQKKAGLCLLRIYRKYPENIKVREWSSNLVKTMDSEILSIVYVSTCLITTICQIEPERYSSVVTKAIMKLHGIIINGEGTGNYLYYKIPAPWLQVRLLRLLQYYPPPENPDVVNALEKVLKKLLGEPASVSKNNNQNNAINSILFEAINYCIHLDPYSDLINRACIILAQFLGSSDPNLRYLALETMAHIAATGDPLSVVSPHTETIMELLKDDDISVQKRALDVLYSICKDDNFRLIVNEVLTFLQDAELELQEEMVLKIAIVAEKFVSEYTWYVDVMFSLVKLAGNAVGESLWHRIIQIVSKHEDLREYASYTILQAVKEPDCTEVAVKIAAYILGEYGDVIVESPNCSPIEQFHVLDSKFGSFSNATRAMLLSTYFKFINLFPEIKREIIPVFEVYSYALDTELQQRACEYLAIAQMEDDSMLQAICQEMPPYDDRESKLISQLAEKLNATEDGRTWVIGGLQDQIDILNRRPTNKIGNTENSSLPKIAILDENPSNLKAAVKKNITSNPNSKVKSNYFKLLYSQNGILYEDLQLQVGLKSEYQGGLGRVGIFLGNKTTSQFDKLHLSIKVIDEHEVEISKVNQLQMSLSGGEQISQLFNVESKTAPSDPPLLMISFNYSGKEVSHEIELPITMVKFFIPVELISEDFFNRWRQLSRKELETQTIVHPPPDSSVNIDGCKNIFRGWNIAVLEGVDNNPANLCAAGIYVSSQMGQVGVLIRLESNSKHRVYRITVRASNGTVSSAFASEVVNILSNYTI